MKTKYLLTFFLLISSISLISTQTESEITKALACMSLAQKAAAATGKEPDPKIFSPMMLCCFINIDDSQSRDILSKAQSGRINDINIDNYRSLLNYNTLYTKYEKEVLMDYSKKLSMAIEKFKQMRGQQQQSDYDDGDGDDEGDGYNYNYGARRGNPSAGNVMGLFARAIGYTIRIANSFGGIIIIMLGMYFILHAMAKLYRQQMKGQKEN